jgi:hypothetical protein
MARIWGRGELKWRGDRLFPDGGGDHLAEIVKDSKYPHMWRIRKPDGTLSDMVNLSRAKDAAMASALRILNTKKPAA